MSGRYTFGDCDLAARRLALVAEVFEASSRRLLATAPTGRALAVDLGCGPGHSTRLLAEMCRPEATVGLDSSHAFVEVAEGQTSDPTVRYAVHDVTTVPLPLGRPADLIHARLLLAHLPDPVGVVERWRSGLAPDGVLLLDEVEQIDAPPGVLREYEELVVARVAAEGGVMYAGRELARLGGRRVVVGLDVALAARIYSLNLATWGDEAVRLGLASPEDLEQIAAGLIALQARPRRATVRWVLRQLTLRR